MHNTYFTSGICLLLGVAVLLSSLHITQLVTAAPISATDVKKVNFSHDESLRTGSDAHHHIEKQSFSTLIKAVHDPSNLVDARSLRIHDRRRDVFHVILPGWLKALRDSLSLNLS